MPFHTTAILRICAALFLRRLPERKAGLRDSSTPKYRSACRNFTGDRFMDPGRRSSSSDSRGVDCVSDPEQHRLSGHHRGPRRNPGDDRPWRVVVGCLALRQKAYRTSGALGAFELYLKRRNPNSVQLLAGARIVEQSLGIVRPMSVNGLPESGRRVRRTRLSKR
jgi:hypothetical protein